MRNWRSRKSGEDKQWSGGAAQTWGQFGTGFQTVRSKISSSRPALDIGPDGGEENDGFDNLDDSLSTTSGSISTVSS